MVIAFITMWLFCVISWEYWWRVSWDTSMSWKAAILSTYNILLQMAIIRWCIRSLSAYDGRMSFTGTSAARCCGASCRSLKYTRFFIPMIIAQSRKVSVSFPWPGCFTVIWTLSNVIENPGSEEINPMIPIKSHCGKNYNKSNMISIGDILVYTWYTMATNKTVFIYESCYGFWCGGRI